MPRSPVRMCFFIRFEKITEEAIILLFKTDTECQIQSENCVNNSGYFPLKHTKSLTKLTPSKPRKCQSKMSFGREADHG